MANLARGKSHFLMGLSRAGLLSWETGNASTCCQEKSTNRWALKCETIEDQPLTHWNLESWKYTELSWLLQWSQIQQMGVFLHLPVLGFSWAGRTSGVDWLRASTVTLCYGVVILFLCFEQDYSVQAQIQIKTSFLQVIHWIKRRVASNYPLSPDCRVICIHPWLGNS